MKSFILFFICVALFFDTGCKKARSLPVGTWRATLKTETGVQIPFNFELIDSSSAKIIYLKNAAERFKVDEVAITEDSVLIQLPLFDSEIKAKRGVNGLKGKWIKHLADKSVTMDFEAKPNTNWRFFRADKDSKYQVSGRWSALFVSANNKDTTLAIGEFEEKDNKVVGTFLTTTGDYRYLEGGVTNDKLFLSSFDGSSAYLFTGELTSDSVITNGIFYSGLSSVESWTAIRDSQAVLPDAYSLTTLKKGVKSIRFSFPDLEGETVSLADDQFKNKVVVVQFLGSWCPNCMDETAYLSSFYPRFKSKGVEVIGLAYERTTDMKRSKANVQKLKERFNIEYPLLLTGYTNKDALKSMPALNAFKAFPTTIIIDKQGLVRKIHTGFSGPGTGKHYKGFVEEFEALINQLLKER